MRGMGDYHRSIMKHRDPRISAFCDHLRKAITLMEDIANTPFRPPEPEVEPKPAPLPAAAPAPVELPPQKLTYTIREAKSALGIGVTRLYELIGQGEIAAIKIGVRTMIPADALRVWLASRPSARLAPKAPPKSSGRRRKE